MFTSDPTLVSPPAGLFSSSPAGLNSLDLSALKSFKTEIITSTCVAVGAGLSPTVIIPDLSVGDGHTSVSFGPGAVTGSGELCFTQDDLATSNWPVGPGNTKPVEVFTIELTGGASLAQNAQLVLSYPSDVNGKVLNMGLNPGDLAIYWLGPENLPPSDQSWYVLGRANVDMTMHTVAGVTSHFSTFALFAAGAADAAASLRPKQRIITPNGDHQNDVAIFPGLMVENGDNVHIFDVRGRRVRHITAPSALSDCNSSFCWDGRDDGGSVVESGVYLYQYTFQGERVSGVVAVAK